MIKAFLFVTGAAWMAAWMIRHRLRSEKLPAEADLICQAWEACSGENPSETVEEDEVLMLGKMTSR